MLKLRAVLFDASCKLCTFWVSFLRKRDRGDLQYISVQSPEGQHLLALHGYPTERFETLVYLDDDKVSDKSAAIVVILVTLGGFWRVASVLFLIPRPLRDCLYLKLAANRYRIFGKVEDCRCGSTPTSSCQ